MHSLFNLIIEVNHLAFSINSAEWYERRISADCQQKLFSPKRDTSGRFLLVTFLEEQKREDGTQVQLACLKMVQTALKNFVR